MPATVEGRCLHLVEISIVQHTCMASVFAKAETGWNLLGRYLTLGSVKGVASMQEQKSKLIFVSNSKQMFLKVCMYSKSVYAF